VQNQSTKFNLDSSRTFGDKTCRERQNFPITRSFYALASVCLWWGGGCLCTGQSVLLENDVFATSFKGKYIEICRYIYPRVPYYFFFFHICWYIL